MIQVVTFASIYKLQKYLNTNGITPTRVLKIGNEGLLNALIYSSTGNLTDYRLTLGDDANQPELSIGFELNKYGTLMPGDFLYSTINTIRVNTVQDILMIRFGFDGGQQIGSNTIDVVIEGLQGAYTLTLNTLGFTRYELAGVAEVSQHFIDNNGKELAVRLGF